VGLCKDMGRVSKQTDKLLATGHQRHYSILYDNAVDCIRQNLLGDVHCIRAQWHRKADTWSPPVPGITDSDKKLADQLAKLVKGRQDADNPKDFDLFDKRIEQVKMQMKDVGVKAEDFGYISKPIEYVGGGSYSPLE